MATARIQLVRKPVVDVSREAESISKSVGGSRKEKSFGTPEGRTGSPYFWTKSGTSIM